METRFKIWHTFKRSGKLMEELVDAVLIEFRGDMAEVYLSVPHAHHRGRPSHGIERWLMRREIVESAIAKQSK